MTFKNYHTKNRTLLLEHTTNFLNQQDARTTDKLSHTALTRIKDFATSGKMLRGIFTMFAYEMYGNKPDNNVLNVSTDM